MSLQRDRGLIARVWRSKLELDNRGNERRVLDEDTPPYEIPVWTMPQRSARAEVPGQQQINVTRLGTKAFLEDVDLYSRVEFLGMIWDIVTPPVYHHGMSRHVRHWTFDIRERPRA